MIVKFFLYRCKIFPMYWKDSLSTEIILIVGLCCPNDSRRRQMRGNSNLLLVELRRHTSLKIILEWRLERKSNGIDPLR